MKKLLLTLLVCVLTLSVCACEKKVSMVNPYESMESLQALNEKANCNMKRINASDESFYFINTVDIAEYNFTYDNVIYTLRAKNTEEDISGIYPNDFDGTLGETVTTKEVNPTLNGDGYVWARWYVDDVQYFLSAANVSVENFKEVYDCIK